MSGTLEEKTYRNNLLHLRNSVIFVLAFMGFLRSPESSLICTKNMKSCEGFISSFIEKSKAIIRVSCSHRVGFQYVSRCLVKIILELLSAFVWFWRLFRAISASGYCKRLVSVNKPISESLRERLSRNPFLAFCRIFLSSVATLPGQVVLLRLQSLVSVIKISNVTAVGPQSLPRILA